MIDNELVHSLVRLEILLSSSVSFATLLNAQQRVSRLKNAKELRDSIRSQKPPLAPLGLLLEEPNA